VSSDMTGSYVSEDGGSSWRMFNLGGVVKFFVCDPRNADVVYARTAGLWRSADRGRAWHLVYPSLAGAERRLEGDHADEYLVTPAGKAPAVRALVVDPDDSRTLYALIAGESEHGLFISRDWGKTWRRETILPVEAEQPLSMHQAQILIDPRSPASNRSIFVIGLHSAHIRQNSEWREYPGPENAKFHSVAAGFPRGGGDPVVLALGGKTWRGGESAPARIFRSTDGGRSWQRIEDRFLRSVKGDASRLELRAIAVSPSNPAVSYLSFRGAPAGEARDGELMGVARSSDTGESWQVVWGDQGKTAAGNVADAWINQRFGPGWGENPFQLAVDPNNADVVFGTDFGRTMRTTNGGGAWEGVYSRCRDGACSTTGLDVTSTYSVHFDPFQPKRLFVSYTDIGLFGSEDGGTTWSSATRNGVPQRWVNTTYWMEFDPKVEGLAWAAMSGTHDLPRPKMWRRQDPQKFTGGVVMSRDGGRSWTVSNEGIGEAAITHLLLDPDSAPQNRTLYACAFGKGVFASTDNGRTWTRKNDGLLSRQPFAWRMARDRQGALYLVIARRSENGSIGNEDDGALFRSRNRVASWERVPLPQGCNGPTSVVIDPKDDNRICLAAWGRAVKNAADVGGGIYLSTDGGQSWRQALASDQHIHDVTIDPETNMYFAAGFESSAYRSDDRGQTWKRIPGLNFKWQRRVVPDPARHGMIYLTTFGGSVWYGPASGDPRAQEDIAPSSMRLMR
jgi:photosystem II stability/assembly factor-like uncharacterized protein